jgi:hypothetical protein
MTSLVVPRLKGNPAFTKNESALSVVDFQVHVDCDWPIDLRFYPCCLFLIASGTASTSALLERHGRFIADSANACTRCQCCTYFVTSSDCARPASVPIIRQCISLTKIHTMIVCGTALCLCRS